MIKSAVPFRSLKRPRRPFVFWHDLAAGCIKAADLGSMPWVFAPADAIPVDELKALLPNTISKSQPWAPAVVVIHKWHLCQPDAASRENAKDFIRAIIDAGAQLGTPAIIGSMQGRFEGEVSKDQALDWLREALSDLGEHAKAAGCR